MYIYIIYIYTTFFHLLVYNLTITKSDTEIDKKNQLENLSIRILDSDLRRAAATQRFSTPHWWRASATERIATPHWRRNAAAQGFSTCHWRRVLPQSRQPPSPVGKNKVGGCQQQQGGVGVRVVHSHRRGGKAVGQADRGTWATAHQPGVGVGQVREG